MTTDYGIEIIKDLESIGAIRSVEDVCKVWSQIRPILVAAQSMLKLLYPPAAVAIGVIISLFDSECPTVPAANISSTRTLDATMLRKAHSKMIAAWQPAEVSQATICQNKCKAQYDRDIAACGDDMDCMNAAFGRYIIRTLRCEQS